MLVPKHSVDWEEVPNPLVVRNSIKLCKRTSVQNHLEYIHLDVGTVSTFNHSKNNFLASSPIIAKFQVFVVLILFLQCPILEAGKWRQA